MTITLAIDRYDRLMPFHDGTVELPSGLDLKVLQVGQEGRLRDGAHRHERMLQDGEFDVAEVSLSSYVAACARGLQFIAIPVFPRRLFSLGQVFVNTRSSFSHPRELAGRTIGLQSFQTTLAVLAKGDMAAEYGLDLRSVRWLTRSAETIEVVPAPGFRVEPMPTGLGLIEALVQGKVDAIFYSRTPWRDPDPSLPIRRLFANPQGEESRYYAKNGYWPIMHLVVLKKAVAERQSELPMQLMRAFESAHRIADGYIDDPGWSRLAWTKYTRESEAASLGARLWPLGVAANRANLERFIGYSYDQGLIDRRIAVEELFHSSVHGT
jgi:4,5-dihydroxyphthalate decarboxylase